MSNVPKEICRVRAGQKAAEAVVVRTPAERWEEQRAEEQRKQLKENLNDRPREDGNDGTPQLR